MMSPIKEAKSIADQLWSSTDMQPDAHRAWNRLGERYPVTKSNGLYCIDLRKVAAPRIPKEVFHEGLTFWKKLQEDLLDGIVYHGTTVEVADLILSTGFRGLEWEDILHDVLAKHNLTEADIPQEMLEPLRETKTSYEHEMHQVSTSPGGGVSLRWAGKGGEVPQQIEAFVLGKWNPRQVENSRLSGDPAVLKCRIKNFQSNPNYIRAKRWVEGMNKLIADGGVTGEFSPLEAAEDVWNSYTNFLCKPEDLEVLEVISGARLQELAKHPLGVSVD